MVLERNCDFFDFKIPTMFAFLLVGILLSNISSSLENPVRAKQSIYSVEKQKPQENKEIKKDVKLTKFQENYEETPCRGPPSTTTLPSTFGKESFYQEADGMGREMINTTEKDERVKNASNCNIAPLINMDLSNSHISLPVNITCNNCTYFHYS